MPFTSIKAITIDHLQVGSASSTNFRMLFNPGAMAGGGDPLDLRTLVNGGPITNVNGYDIVFTSDSAGLVPLDFEVESYTGTNGILIAWVRIPTLSNITDTVIYICYGNAAITTYQGNNAGVYNANILAEWHLPNGVTLSGTDSTANALSLTNHGMGAVAGHIYGGLVGDGTHYMEQASASALLKFAKTDPFTILFWYNPNGHVSEELIIGSEDP